MKALKQPLSGDKLTLSHLLVLFLCMLGMLIDTYDLYLLGWIMPAVAIEFDVPVISLTYLLIFQQVAMLVGSIFLAPLADRVGRRPVLLLSFAAIGIISVIAAYSPSLAVFVICRLAISFLSAALIPILLTLAMESAPPAYRSTFATASLCGAFAGPFVGAYMQAYVLEPYGWEGALLLGAGITLAAVPLFWMFMPESPDFIADRQARVENRLDHPIRGGLKQSGPRRIGITGTAKEWLESLLITGDTSKTLMLWGAFILSYSALALWFSWGTTLFRDVLGMSYQKVALANMLHSLFAIPGALLVGAIIDRFKSRAVLPAAFLLGGVASVAIGLTAGTTAMFVFIAVLGGTHIAGQASLGAFAASLYSSDRRAAGVGAAYGAGRVGSILGPVIGQQVLTFKLGAIGIFGALSASLLAACILLFILVRRHQSEPDTDVVVP